MGMLIKNGSTPVIVFLMVDATDDETAETGLSPTVQISKNGGSFAAVTNAVSEIGNGWYKVTLTATETNTDGPLIVRATGSGADEWRDYHQVYTTLAADAVQVSGDSTAADNLEAMYDGTGYAGGTERLQVDVREFGDSNLALTTQMKTDVGDAALDEVVESTLTLRQLVRVFLSALAGKSNGGGTTTVNFRDYADSKNRVTATVDADGNRTAISVDGS
jgi:hypothetical protein